MFLFCFLENKRTFVLPSTSTFCYLQNGHEFLGLYCIFIVYLFTLNNAKKIGNFHYHNKFNNNNKILPPFAYSLQVVKKSKKSFAKSAPQQILLLVEFLGRGVGCGED